MAGEVNEILYQLELLCDNESFPGGLVKLEAVFTSIVKSPMTRIFSPHIIYPASKNLEENFQHHIDPLKTIANTEDHEERSLANFHLAMLMWGKYKLPKTNIIWQGSNLEESVFQRFTVSTAKQNPLYCIWFFQFCKEYLCAHAVSKDDFTRQIEDKLVELALEFFDPNLLLMLGNSQRQHWKNWPILSRENVYNIMCNISTRYLDNDQWELALEWIEELCKLFTLEQMPERELQLKFDSILSTIGAYFLEQHLYVQAKRAFTCARERLRGAHGAFGLALYHKHGYDGIYDPEEDGRLAKIYVINAVTIALENHEAHPDEMIELLKRCRDEFSEIVREEIDEYRTKYPAAIAALESINGSLLRNDGSGVESQKAAHTQLTDAEDTASELPSSVDSIDRSLALAQLYLLSLGTNLSGYAKRKWNSALSDLIAIAKSNDHPDACRASFELAMLNYNDATLCFDSPYRRRELAENALHWFNRCMKSSHNKLTILRFIRFCKEMIFNHIVNTNSFEYQLRTLHNLLSIPSLIDNAGKEPDEKRRDELARTALTQCWEVLENTGANDQFLRGQIQGYLTQIQSQFVRIDVTTVLQRLMGKIMYEVAIQHEKNAEFREAHAVLKNSHDNGYLPGSEMYLLSILKHWNNESPNIETVFEVYNLLVTNYSYKLNSDCLDYLLKLTRHSNVIIHYRAQLLVIQFCGRVTSSATLVLLLTHEQKGIQAAAYERIGVLLNEGVFTPQTLPANLKDTFNIWFPAFQSRFSAAQKSLDLADQCRIQRDQKLLEKDAHAPSFWESSIALLGIKSTARRSSAVAAAAAAVSAQPAVIDSGSSSAAIAAACAAAGSAPSAMISDASRASATRVVL